MLAILLISLPAFIAAAEDYTTIRSITIQGNTRTRTEVIRRELLFSQSQLLDDDLILESERNLRRYFFLGSVEIKVEREGKFADIRVEVKDLYSRALSPLVSGKAGEISYGGVALDYNLLGRGQELEITAEHDAITGNRGEVFYRIPRLSGSRYLLSTTLGVAEEDHAVRGTLSHPFYALSVPWSYGISIFSEESIQRLYSNRVLAAKYTDRTDGGNTWVTRSYGTRIKYRPGISLFVTDRKFLEKDGFTYVPTDRRRIIPSLRFLIWEPRYERTRYLFRLGRVEDVQTGSWISLRAGVSSEALGSDRNFSFAQIELASNLKPSSTTYFFSRFFLSSRYQNSTYANLIASTDVQLYSRVGDVHSLAFRIRWDALGRSEDQSQLLLGVVRGLRGYSPRRFDGTRRLILNAEARPTLLRRPTYVLAGAAFVDGGSAWTPGKTSSKLNLGAGLGGRLTLTRIYNNSIFRADLAYGFEDRQWLLFVGLGQYF